MCTFWTIRHNDFYSISKKELSKFFNKLEKKCLDIYQACERDKLLSEIYKEDEIIRAKAVFSFHPYHDECPWLLYKVEYSLPGCDFDTVKTYNFQNHYKTWYSYYNNNLKGLPTCNFNYFYIMPTITIDVECKVDDTKVLDKEGNLFEKATYKDTKMVYFNYLRVTLDINDFVLSEKYLDKFSPISDALRVVCVLTDSTGEVYVSEEIFDILTLVKNWDRVLVDNGPNPINEMLTKHILVKQYIR